MAFFSKFKKSWAFIVIAFSIGLLLLSLSFFDKSIIASDGFKNALRIAGQTVLSSAVFLGIVKTLQYTDYFKDEINEVMFTDKYLKGLSQESLKEKWILVTNVLHSNTFPSLKNNLNRHLLDSIIAIPKNYTHSHMRMSFTITAIGKDKQFFTLEEKVDMRIIGQKDTAINFSINSYVLKEQDPADKSNIKMTQLVVDGVDLIAKVPTSDPIPAEDGLVKIGVVAEIPLPLKSSFSIVKELQTIHSTRLNAFWRANFETFVEDGLEVVLHYDTNQFEVDILAIGQTIKLERDNFDKQTVKYTCSNLIFQNDCLILIIKYK